MRKSLKKSVKKIAAAAATKWLNRILFILLILFHASTNFLTQLILYIYFIKSNIVSFYMNK